MTHLHAINVFGLGAAIVGIGGALTAGRACGEALAVPRHRGGGSLVCAMIFILLVDLFIVAMGVWITLLDTTIAGGANG